MKKILITGSCGHKMSNLIRKLYSDNSQYIISSIDNICNSSLNNFYWNKHHSFYTNDICDYNLLDLIFKIERPEIVIHGADVKSNNLDIIKTNVLGTETIISLCKEYKVDKVLYISTSKIDTEPKTTYSISKYSSELLVQNSGLEYIICRVCDTYGPRQNINKFIPNSIKSILNNEEVILTNGGIETNQWLHVFDLSNIILKILELDLKNETINLGTPSEFSKLEVIYEICKCINSDYDKIRFTEGTSNTNYSVDISRMKEFYSYPIKFKDGIKSVCEWYQNNKWFLK